MKNWADPGLGSTIALTVAALSEKKKILFVFGKSVTRFEAIVAAFARAAISASNTSAWPPRPSLLLLTSLPRRYATAAAPTLKNNPDLLSFEPSV